MTQASVGCLGYLGLAVKDPDAWSAFATGVLGLMPGEAAPEASSDVRRFRLDDRAWRIAVEPGEDDDVAYLGFEVAGAGELAEFARRIEAAVGGVAEGDPALLADRGVLGLITCHDPDGLPVEIFYGPTLRTETPFVSPAGVPGFVTGEQGLGHVVISTRHIEAARRFYQDLLGFRLSDIIRMGAAPRTFEMEFFHCNPRHHTLALIPFAAPRRLHHFMIQAFTLDAVGFALERAQAAGTLIAATLGRHTNDHMVSFYARTPSGFEVEFGFGAQEVDDATWRVTRHDKPSSWGHRRP
ncbi:MAG: 2,3-dihydroxybiphenyl 1,2-dioxygenase [Caulobacteraceae bacterium]|nr:2,3-dihydroxybiphenyl 1,2-dioxygenase [Caulobacteraceae bacterium]